MKKIAWGLLALGVIPAAVIALWPWGPRDAMPYDDRTGRPRTLFVGTDYAAVTGTPWATAAAVEVLERGGTACDAAVTALLVLNVTHGEAASFPGVAPTLVYEAASGRVRSYIGAGTAPAAATLERFLERGFETVPELDIWAQLVPASPDVIVALLEDCVFPQGDDGRLTFGDLAAPAIAVAREGFPAHTILVRNLDLPLHERIGFSFLMPYNAEVYMRGEWWRGLHLHERMTFPDLADTLAELAAAEAEATGTDRSSGLRAVRDHFYRGPIAARIAAFHRQEGGLMTADDLASYRGGWEDPLVGRWGPYTIHTSGTWTQGLVVPLTLAILEDIDLAVLGHNSPRYVHTVAQALELSLADRDAYVADDRFVDVPVEELLSAEYAVRRRDDMMARAFGPLPAPGRLTASVLVGQAVPADPAPSAPGRARRQAQPALQGPGTQHRPASRSMFAKALDRLGQDTSQLVVHDRYGNVVVMTPSDFPKTPMVPGTGLTLGNRMTQFRLDADNVGVLAPGKRPRITPHAVMITENERLHLAFSTPGGDMQAQALVQVFLNLHVFGMDLQTAIDAPRFYSISAPSSFAPHEAYPGTLRLESSLYRDAAAGLAELGYTLLEDPDWDNDFGAVGAILLTDDGHIHAGADSREETWADGR